jgi:hypothetical protein
MLQAAEELPDVASAPGRLTKWSAEGMLARFYLSRAGVESTGGARVQSFLDSAKYYAQDVINNSGKSLLPNYRDLFLAAPTGTNYNNNNESLFELQWVYSPNGSNYGYANSYPSYINCDGSVNTTNDAWGGDKSATFWILSQYDGFTLNATGDTLTGSTADTRLHETFMLPGFSYPEITQTCNGVSQKPFIYPNNTFGSPAVFGGSLDSVNATPASIKKYFIGQAQDVGNNAYELDYPNDTYMLRLAEMYLIYADAALGNSASTSDATALQYFNAVHTRAGLPAVTCPLTFDDIFREKVLEFAMEGRMWYLLVDLHYWNPQKAYSIIASQYRAEINIQANAYPNPTSWKIIKLNKAQYSTVYYATANDGNFQLPIPQTEQTSAPNLLLPPVDYYAQ